MTTTPRVRRYARIAAGLALSLAPVAVSAQGLPPGPYAIASGRVNFADWETDPERKIEVINPADFSTGSNATASRSGEGYFFRTSSHTSGYSATAKSSSRADRSDLVLDVFSSASVGHRGFIDTGIYLPNRGGTGTISFTATFEASITGSARGPRDGGYAEVEMVFGWTDIRIDGFEGAVDGDRRFREPGEVNDTVVITNAPFTFEGTDDPNQPLRTIRLALYAKAKTYCFKNAEFEASSSVSLSGVNITVNEGPPPADSDVIEWKNPAGGSFATENNWEPAQVPVKTVSRADTAIFNLPAAYTVSAPSAGTERMRVDGGVVTLNTGTASAASLGLDDPSVSVAGGAVLNLAGGTLNSVHSTIGRTISGIPAQVNVTNNNTRWSNQGRLTIGGGAPGRLSLASGATVTSAESRLGSGSRGEALIEGDATWNTGNLALGYTHTGELVVQAGGHLLAGDVVALGFGEGSHGSLHVTGTTPAGASSFSAGTVRVGQGGVGKLLVDKGGFGQINHRLIVASTVFDAGIGGVLVGGMENGIASELDVSGSIEIGAVERMGLLYVTDGGLVSAESIEIGVDGFGEVSVTGATGNTPARLVSDDLTVGSNAEGSLDILGGAFVETVRLATVGGNAGMSDGGKVSIRGHAPALSNWQIGESLYLYDTGVLQLDEFAAVTIGNASPVARWVHIGTGGLLLGTGTIITTGGTQAAGGVDNFFGTVSPGASPGRLTIEGDYIQRAAGVLEIELGGTEPGQGYDQLVVTGTATFEAGTTIRVSLIDSNPDHAVSNLFIPQSGDTFRFLVADAIVLPAGETLADLIEFTNLPAGVTIDFATSVVDGQTVVTGTATSTLPPADLRILQHPQHAAVPEGLPATFAVTAEGTGPFAYQWRRDGLAIDGATASTLTLPSVQPDDAAFYSVTVTAGSISLPSKTATLVVTPPPGSGSRLLNLSTRALNLTGDQILIPGFVLGGTGTKRVLIRAVGPTLASFGVSGTQPDPQMSVVSGGVTLATNDNWATQTGGSTTAADIIAVSAQVGAFPLVEGSADAALLFDLAPGLYTVPTTGVGDGTGVAIVEVYDADAGTPTATLLNISNRGFVGTGDNIMIPGIVVSESGPRTFLLRAVGPTLADFDVDGVLADPVLTLFNGSTPVLTNDNWGDDPRSAITRIAAADVGAFALPEGSADAAVVVTLPPGAYTLQASGKDGSSGVALVEVYLVE